EDRCGRGVVAGRGRSRGAHRRGAGRARAHERGPHRAAAGSRRGGRGRRSRRRGRRAPRPRRAAPRGPRGSGAPPDEGRPRIVSGSLLRIWAIALNTFREAMRNRVLYVLVLFAVGLMGFSIVLGELSLHEDVRVIKDIGLAGTSIVGLAIALFLGV